MLRGVVPDNSCIVLATAARVEIVFRTGGARVEKGGVQRARVEQSVGPGRRRAVEARRGRSQVTGTLRVKTPTPNTHNNHYTEDFSVFYRARRSGEGPCRIRRHRLSRCSDWPRPLTWSAILGRVLARRRYSPPTWVQQRT